MVIEYGITLPFIFLMEVFIENKQQVVILLMEHCLTLAPFSPIWLYAFLNEPQAVYIIIKNSLHIFKLGIYQNNIRLIAAG